MTRVLVLTTEPLPVEGSPTTGAGLRAWGLANALANCGFEVAIGAPSGALPGAYHPDLAERFSESDSSPLIVRAFDRNPAGFARILADSSPDVVVLQHWGMAAELPELAVHLAIDLAGPHLLERLFWGDPDPGRSLMEKLAALRRADFVCCSGHFQRFYFLPYLAQAGWDLRAGDLLPVIPFGVPPRDLTDEASTESLHSGDPVFVYGGAFLAWQDPTRPISWLLDELDAAGRGRLLFYGGSHPVIDASGGRFTELAETLSHHPRVEMRGFRAFAELVDEYRHEGTIALDLMARNPERELAYTTRTLVYLFAGLPVLYNNYSELSDVVRRHNCGWTLDPEDEVAFRETIRFILSGDAPLDEMRAGALAAADEHSWDHSIEPLAAFCRAPRIRENKTAVALARESELRETRNLRAERDHLNHELATIRGKFLFRMQRRLPGLASPLAPLAWLASWPIAAYIYLRLRRTATK